MQVVDAATTMGLLFGAMGVGAFIGPVGFNMFTPPKCAPVGLTPFGRPAINAAVTQERNHRWLHVRILSP